MFSPEELERLRVKGAEWREKNASRPQRRVSYKTPSQIPVEPVYTPENLPDSDYLGDLGMPGEYPYLRGIHATGYRERLWTMRMFAGFGLPEETNARFKFLLDSGQTGLSVAFDMPTLYGYDTDDPRAKGEFGKCGVAVSSLADMETIFDGLPLDQITTSMTINSPAAIIWAMYLSVAEKQGGKVLHIGHDQPVWQGHELAVHVVGRVFDRYVVSEAFTHLLYAVGARQDGHEEALLGFLPHHLLQLAAHQQIEHLVGAAKLHVRFDLHRVVGLK